MRLHSVVPLLTVTVAVLSLALASAASADTRPNILLIYTDDQPKSTLNSVTMPETLNWLDDGGVEFKNAYASYPLCCPSRATMLTGKYAHNHRVLSNGGTFVDALGNLQPLGGMAAFNAAPGEEPAFSIQKELREAGYRTGYVGKYFNGYEDDLANGPTALPRKEPNWDAWYTLIGQYNDMWPYKLAESGLDPKLLNDDPADDEDDLSNDPITKKTYGYGNPNSDPELGPIKINDESNYQTNVLGERAEAALQQFKTANTKAGEDRPFFLTFAPHAPHGEGDFQAGVEGGPACTPGQTPTWIRPAKPADRQEILDAEEDGLLPFPPSPAYNADAAFGSKPNHVSALPSLYTTATPTSCDPENRMLHDQILERRRDRMASLRAVDRAIDALRVKLDELGEADNTLVIFTTDNGMFEGEHRIPEGKIDVYDGASKLPLLMRRPGTNQALNIQTPVSNADIGATILDVAGVPDTTVASVDGRPLTDTAAATGGTGTRPILIESGSRTNELGTPLPNGEIMGADKPGQPDYQAIRTTRYLYVEREPVGQGGLVELYDLALSPFQLDNVLAAPVPDPNPYEATRATLAAKLAALRTCAGTGCRVGTGPIPDPPA